MTDWPRCSGCYDSYSGPWCDNCDIWPCLCILAWFEDPEATN